jgi:hypothetical protein
MLVEERPLQPPQNDNSRYHLFHLELLSSSDQRQFKLTVGRSLGTLILGILAILGAKPLLSVVLGVVTGLALLGRSIMRHWRSNGMVRANRG